jgi:hypothetical protein
MSQLMPSVPIIALGTPCCAYCLVLTNIHTPRLEIFPCFQNLSLQFRIRIRNVVESEDSPTEFEQEVCAEGNKSPEWNLVGRC